MDWLKRRIKMKRVAKSGKNIGIAIKVQGQTVGVISHPKYKGMWQFEFDGENGLYRIMRL